MNTTSGIQNWCPVSTSKRSLGVAIICCFHVPGGLSCKLRTSENWSSGNESEMGEEKSDSSFWIRAGETGMDSRDSVRTAEALDLGEAVPLHAVPNGYAAYSQNVGSLGLVAFCLGKCIYELLFL